MIKLSRLIKHYGEFIILFLTIFLVLPGCGHTPKRLLCFSQVMYNSGNQKEATSVSVQDFEIVFSSTVKNMETNSIFKKRLQERLLDVNLNPVTEEDAAYHLGGQLEITEKANANWLAFPTVIIGVMLFPISPFFVPHVPANDVNYKTTTTMNLRHVDSGKVILTRTIENNEEITASDADKAGITSPDKKLNQTLVRNVDQALQEIAGEISQAIVNSKTASTTISTGL